MEKADNPFEAYRPVLFPRLERVAKALFRVLTFGEETPNTGASPMLDEQLKLPFVMNTERHFEEYDPGWRAS